MFDKTKERHVYQKKYVSITITSLERPEAPMHSGILRHDSNVKRGMGRPKLT